MATTRRKDKGKMWVFFKLASVKSVSYNFDQCNWHGQAKCQFRETRKWYETRKRGKTGAVTTVNINHTRPCINKRYKNANHIVMQIKCSGIIEKYWWSNKVLANIINKKERSCYQPSIQKKRLSNTLKIVYLFDPRPILMNIYFYKQNLIKSVEDTKSKKTLLNISFNFF